MVHKMQRLAMNVSNVSDTSSTLPAAIPTNRQKCATIVEEAEVDDLGDDDDGQDNNGFGVEGRKKYSVCACYPRDCQIRVAFEMIRLS